MEEEDMDAHEREARIREKFESKMLKISRKLEELQTGDDLHVSLDEIDANLDEIDHELDAFGHDQAEIPGLRERLEAKRERLLAKQERLKMKVDMRQEMRERLTESLNEMQSQLQDTLDMYRAQRREHTEDEDRWRRRHGTPPPPVTGSRQLQEERRKILEMVQQGTISADDAAQLLDALRNQEETSRRPHRRPRWVRIRVTDAKTETVRVNLTLPVGLVRAGLRAGGSIAGVAGLDTAGLEEMLDRGEMGHILDVQDNDGGERVEIFVE
jgi:DNA repair exonuclease SbcCD ATPase subunit